MNEIKETVVNNRTVKVHQKGKGGSVILWGVGDNEDEALSKAVLHLEEMLKADDEYIIITYRVENWFRDYSPWKMLTDAGEVFEGLGLNTLCYLKESLVPFVKENFGENKDIYIAGYSLSGLFSLWAFYETDIFKGVACCSGSLWFENWDNYAECKKAPKESKVYLSLGGKEANSKNKYMATIYEQYKKQEKRLKADANVKSLVFEMNSGGHFANPEKRMAKAFYSLIKS
ncbi:MAG: alpha/beta hydrolase [Clostridia bacterium]|nr:alpha/beta hydrolase [Clostridia bacterium]